MRTAVYVDGFNLFHRLLQGRPEFKWLDLISLASTALKQENDVVLLRYFTARVADTASDPDKATRQDVYLRALASSGVHIHLGAFRLREKRAKLVTAPTNGSSPYVTVWAREEKGSDVNLAVHMTNDAWKNAYDCAVIVSNDSDLAEAARVVRDMGKVVGILSPVASPTSALREHADFVRNIRAAHLSSAQFPPAIPLVDGGMIHRPNAWAASAVATQDAPTPGLSGALLKSADPLPNAFTPTY
ncbi:NYN domain-containing protein [Bacillus sp. NP157]|nr:NYN domain-containing protein [Bacillus sp. NP157]